MPLQVTRNVETLEVLRDLRVFDTFEVAPVVWFVETDGTLMYTRIEESDLPERDPNRVVWTVYGHYDGSVVDHNVLGSITSICDCEDKPTAELIAKLLEDHRYCERRGT